MFADPICSLNDYQELLLTTLHGSKGKKSSAEFTASEEGIAGSHIPNAHFRVQKARIPHHMSGEPLANIPYDGQKYTHTSVMPRHRSYSIFFISLCSIPRSGLVQAFSYFSVKQVNQNHLCYSGSRVCWK